MYTYSDQAMHSSSTPFENCPAETGVHQAWRVFVAPRQRAEHTRRHANTQHGEHGALCAILMSESRCEELALPRVPRLARRAPVDPLLVSP